MELLGLGLDVLFYIGSLDFPVSDVQRDLPRPSLDEEFLQSLVDISRNRLHVKTYCRAPAKLSGLAFWVSVSSCS